MSSVSSFFLMVLLYSSSLASNARPLSSYRVADKEDRAKEVLISSKENEPSKFEPSMSKELKHDIRGDSATAASNKKYLKGSKKGKKYDIDRHLLKRKLSSKKGKVTWRVPDNKDDHEHQPGFNLDYSPPKTHPPHHN